ncbi:MAG: hypothetical protein KC468_08895, partial [Myxococcales bacterium]|nr:hypothetical protein [Myxococcales bacterium]
MSGGPRRRVTLPGARLGAGALLVCALACDPATKPSSQPKTTHPSAGEGSAGGCVGADEVALTGDVWARFEGLACPWIVTLDGAGALELVSLERGRAPARGRAPTGCDA